ncbi:MAG: LysR family transcriptional regulator [Nitratireductor sp.]|nr:LysR family transcriptional regulator [Nitratireductor sp.]MCB1456211.1 LysR family transcriptional regulator [Nitratireductor sp.]MCB1459948.1 LysR family transcriptional regulator [Nitratireductor sp.]
MDWDKLRIFHAVAEAGSFTHAANTLNLSQSAISRQISSLEHDLNVPLFHRHARGLVMTEQGDTLYRTAHDVLLKLDAVRNQLTDSTEKPEGKLRVTTTVGLGTGWLTSRLHEFLELYPDVKLELILENEELDLATRQADCAIRLRQPQQSDLIQRRLFTVHFHIYASPGYVKRHGQPLSIADLDNHRIVTFGENAPPYLAEMNWLERAGRPVGQPRLPVCSVNNVLALRKVVESGAGIAVLPDYVVEDRHALLQLIQNAEVPEFDTYFCYPEALRSSAKLKAFRDFLISKARLWQF